MNSDLKNSLSLISAVLKQYLRGFLFILIFLPPIGCSASVFINEIAWMGTATSSNDEWIELYNDSSQSVDLFNWEITAKNGKMIINLDGKIDGNSFYLLERTDDNSVPNIPADKIYTGSLANTGETLNLYDNFGKIVNAVDCSSGWFAGDNATKKTMERKGYGDGSSDWVTSINVGGTPSAKNSISDNQIVAETTDTKTNIPTAPPIIEENPVKTYPSGIIINELLPSPQGSDEQNEWIELYNQNAEKIDLSEWKLKDELGKSTTFIFPEKTFIDPLGFLIFSRNTTKIILNNDNDEISLINPNGELVDRANYSKAPIGQSYSKINNEWAWNKTLTPGSKNILSSTTIDKTNITKNNVGKFSEAKNNLASIESQISKNSSEKSVSTLLIAAVLAVVSGIIILFIKKFLTR